MSARYAKKLTKYAENIFFTSKKKSSENCIWYNHSICVFFDST